METQHVVVAYDFSEPADLALERAVELACRAPNHHLHFITALDPHHGIGLEPGAVVDYQYAERVQDKLSELLHALFGARALTGEVHFFVHARIGHATDEILDLAKEVGADLIIVGSHGRTGIKRLLLGSVSEAVVRGARCPVVIARAKGYPDVHLETVVDAPGEHHARRPRPHRYTYVDPRVDTGPPAWPLH